MSQHFQSETNECIVNVSQVFSQAIGLEAGLSNKEFALRLRGS